MKSKLSLRGFTLVELLIVMAILAVLIGISVAGIGYALRQSRNIARKSAMANLDRALQAYYSDELQYPDTGLIGGNSFNDLITDTNFLFEYLEGSWEAPPNSKFIYRTDADGYFFVVCSRMEESAGNYHYLCEGPGIGQGSFPTQEEQPQNTTCVPPVAAGNCGPNIAAMCGEVDDTGQQTGACTAD